MPQNVAFASQGACSGLVTQPLSDKTKNSANNADRYCLIC
ncbi:hypothetical protein RVIR1_10340 [Candidatus Rickettsiella viridis]|uniref:Uncharacterized protein n=1 Tax=Candidatus Rickettsiella viridis TaxID=676208 RepID=A0A2Z5UT54_9COXI|nr:hypothetical protein RVIR1_02440 [Candidatus Rickettsiella viridis]BBB15506.1 hypothetical protein RVIR1_10340 [Candidatus Rickettsiella viridis]